MAWLSLPDFPEVDINFLNLNKISCLFLYFWERHNSKNCNSYLPSPAVLNFIKKEMQNLGQPLQLVWNDRFTFNFRHGIRSRDIPSPDIKFYLKILWLNVLFFQLHFVNIKSKHFLLFQIERSTFFLPQVMQN